MPRNRVVFGLLIGLSCILGAPVTAQTPFESDERRKLLSEEWRDQAKMVDELKTKVLTGVRPEDKSLVESIDFRVFGCSEQESASCFTRGDSVMFPFSLIDGDRVVALGQGFLRQLYLFIEAELYGSLYNKQKEVDAFTKMVSDRLRQNAERGADVSAVFVPAASDYFKWDSETQTRIDPMANALWQLNIAFIIAHEAGHHALHHTEQDRSKLTISQKIELEEAADAWGIRTMLAAGIPTAGAAMTLAMLDEMYLPRRNGTSNKCLQSESFDD